MNIKASKWVGGGVVEGWVVGGFMKWVVVGWVVGGLIGWVGACVVLWWWWCVWWDGWLES